MPPGDLHTSRPSVYLDQWVWVRLACVVEGKPREPGDTKALEAVQGAAAAGVAFPLSSTHYIETAQVKRPKQRRDLARVMASISYFRTVRGGRVLFRHQMLTAMHELFGRPAFRPTPPDVLGLGANWAFAGEEQFIDIRDGAGDRTATEADRPGVGRMRREANQLRETMAIAGPADDEVELLRAHGYRPESTTQMSASRLEWEDVFGGLLREAPVSTAELRVRVTARELLHEHFDLFQQLMADYGLTLQRALGIHPDHPEAGRAKMMAFSDRIASMRLAVDMKAELFRNATRTWKVNDLHDIDALSLVIPYCHAVVTDRDAADRVRRTGGDRRHNTNVICDLAQVVELLPDLVTAAAAIGGDPTGWDTVGPGNGFMATLPDGSWPALHSARRR